MLLVTHLPKGLSRCLGRICVWISHASVWRNRSTFLGTKNLCLLQCCMFTRIGIEKLDNPVCEHSSSTTKKIRCDIPVIYRVPYCYLGSTPPDLNTIDSQCPCRWMFVGRRVTTLLICSARKCYAWSTCYCVPSQSSDGTSPPVGP